MSDHQADYPIATMCRVLGVSSSGYHAWVKRRPSRRAETDAVLIAAIRVAHHERGTSNHSHVQTTVSPVPGLELEEKDVFLSAPPSGTAGVEGRLR